MVNTVQKELNKFIKLMEDIAGAWNGDEDLLFEEEATIAAEVADVLKKYKKEQGIDD